MGCKRITKRPRSPSVVAEARDDLHAPGCGSQLLVAQQLTHGSHHFRRQAEDQRGQAPALDASDTTQLRNYPTVQWPMGASATASWVSIINRVTSSYP